MKVSTLPLVVSRRARTPHDKHWSEARSWFGGLPRLGAQPWPCGQRSGRPLVFAAQLDLSEIAEANPTLPLPSEGSLAFFLEECAVVYVPADANRAPTVPPAGAMPAFEPLGDIYPQKPSPWARQTFPYWPVEFTALDLGDLGTDVDDESGGELRAVMTAAVAERFKQRRYVFSAKEAFEKVGEPEETFWWHGAHA